MKMVITAKKVTKDRKDTTHKKGIKRGAKVIITRHKRKDSTEIREELLKDINQEVKISFRILDK